MLKNTFLHISGTGVLSSKISLHKRCIILLTVITIGIVFGMSTYPCHAQIKKGETVHNNLNITVVYDNNPYKPELETAWGFSCVIRGTQKTILFDTGGDGSILLSNMKRLDINPHEIDLVIISHIHGDHTGGLHSFLRENHKVTVYLPKSFPKDLKKDVQRYGGKVSEVRGPLKICEDVYSTGELGTWIKEQSLIIHTDRGSIVISGCAHPGIVKIVTRTKDLIKDDVLLVLGGFHLGGKSKGQIETIISSFKKLRVKHVGPCHCSGNTARRLFEREYEKNYINVGVGKIILF